MLVLSLSMVQMSVTLVVSMVVLVVVTAALEVRTPAPKARATSVSVPRRIEGSVEELPVVDLVAARRRIDAREAERRAAPAAVGVATGPDPLVASSGETAPEPVEVSPVEPVVELDGPATEVVPVVDMQRLATDAHVDAAGAEALSEIARNATVPAMPRSAEDLPAASLDRDPTVRARTREDLLAATADRLDALLSARRAAAAEVEAKAGAEAYLSEEADLRSDGPPTEPVPLVELLADLSAADERPERSERPRPSTVFVAAVDRPDGPVVELGEPGADREVAGVLFAAYVAGRFAERSRVTGWVTAVAPPTSIPAMDAGVRLRGRPARIVDLLSCTDGARNWVTLDVSVDIQRGLQRHKPVDEVLKGLLWWWFAVTDERARVPSAYVASLRDALEAVDAHLDPNPLAPRIRALRDLVDDAARHGAGLRIESLTAQGSDARRHRSRSGSDTARELIPQTR